MVEMIGTGDSRVDIEMAKIVAIAAHTIATITTGKVAGMKIETGDNGFADFGTLWDGHTKRKMTALG